MDFVNDNHLFQCAKERGRITLKYITIIEQAVINSLCGDLNSTSLPFGLNNSNLINNNFSIYPFQIGYTDSGQDYFLYLITFKEKEREDWIQTLRSGKKCNISVTVFLYLYLMFMKLFQLVLIIITRSRGIMFPSGVVSDGTVVKL